MKAITYYPQDNNRKEELANMVASLHAEAIAERISKLEWSAADKKRLYDVIISAHKTSTTLSEI